MIFKKKSQIFCRNTRCTAQQQQKTQAQALISIQSNLICGHLANNT